jgi:hypothetical protein
MGARMNPRLLALSMLLAVAVVGGCRHRSAAGAAPSATALSVALPHRTLVFVDQEQGCNTCSRDEVDQAWKALQEVAQGPADLSVERVHVDREPWKVQPFQEDRPYSKLPAIYILDDQGDIVGLLQGAIDAKQIADALK